MFINTPACYNQAGYLATNAKTTPHINKQESTYCEPERVHQTLQNLSMNEPAQVHAQLWRCVFERAWVGWPIRVTDQQQQDGLVQIKRPQSA